jgi:hypothetical protein
MGEAMAASASAEMVEPLVANAAEATRAAHVAMVTEAVGVVAAVVKVG